ncbi:Zinc finger, SWIM-type [Cynara cardunculus var. scolymus]|uniref:Zinc finger, SWIM-type n=1 Tax=Cynara cardunculus var. scolymus TaxID=59895 RepID=A0A118K0M5_CYNCS|nr:Zinc finger, SWIM-type [Cynara cardunculus var. scolymus]
MMNNGKKPIDSSMSINSDEGTLDDMEVQTWESNEVFYIGFSPFKKVHKICEEIGLIEDVESHGTDDTTGYTDIQDDKNPALDQIDHSLSISLDGTNWFTPVVQEVVKPIIGISNMGATWAHKLHTSLRGGYEYGGPTVVDYQNYKRDYDNFVGCGDAKVLVDVITKKKDDNHNFFFEYNCVGSELHTILWLDEVVHNLKESNIVCSCNHIGRHGYLCRHVFKVLLNVGVESIPEKYILRRWRRDLMPIELQNSRQRICDIGEDQRRIINDTYDVIDDVLDILRDNKEKLESFVPTIKELRDDLAKDRTYEPSMKRKECGIVQILGFPRPDNTEIHLATGIRNKGCGTSKILIGAVEKAAVKSSRAKRMCSGCKLLSNHDIRNCPAKKKLDYFVFDVFEPFVFI